MGSWAKLNKVCKCCLSRNSWSIGAGNYGLLRRRDDGSGVVSGTRNLGENAITIGSGVPGTADTLSDFTGVNLRTLDIGKRPIITRPEQVAAGSHLWDPAVRLFPYMLPVPYHWMPGHQSLQLFMRRGFAQLGQQAQYQQKVFVWINAVGLGRFYQ